MTSQSLAEVALMAQRIAQRRQEMLREFGFFTAQELAAHHRYAQMPAVFIADWCHAHKVFGMPNQDAYAKAELPSQQFRFQQES